MFSESKKMSLAQCKKVIGKERAYTDEEVIQIRDFLYRLAELDYEVYLKSKQRESELNKDKKKEG